MQKTFRIDSKAVSRHISASMKTMVNDVSKLQGQVFAALLALSTFFSPALLAQSDKAGGPDKIKTDQGDLVIHPINHATTVLEWNGKAIYIDPVGAEKRYVGLPKPDLILITDVHGDHLDPK